MSEQQLPPTIDPIAAQRWHARTAQASPWLHEEVARRMQERLQWMASPPANWCDWDPLNGGIEGHALVQQQFAQAACRINETSSPAGLQRAQQLFAKPWWNPGRWSGPAQQFGKPEDASVQMLWANMALHTAANPQALIAQWHKALATGGYVMFSCLGPDTVREIHRLYADLGWPVPGHSMTDMHDWGDMLVHAGFAEPVMDMERITLTFATPERLLRELRELGRNLHPQRFGALRGRGFRRRLEEALRERLADPAQDGPLALTFEIIYGHAFKPEPRVKLEASSAVSLDDMRTMLRKGRQ
ncbi:class I SAM-dependent methyltransferase [Diaphorobacter aerolatus]|uniref:Biotin synthase n=1 Tax=Diaphorobacter aerolatus TaxID=1288495 RepID=A0A7H0GHQ8_9BURK|nr:biotin synthase [Diaphorobacter aerolatus]QNP47824.1 biotin synthase [Diaphorobacter aerolatus]